jgi:hypothetical protein
MNVCVHVWRLANYWLHGPAAVSLPGSHHVNMTAVCTTDALHSSQNNMDMTIMRQSGISLVVSISALRYELWRHGENTHEPRGHPMNDVQFSWKGVRCHVQQTRWSEIIPLQDSASEAASLHSDQVVAKFACQFQMTTDASKFHLSL